MIIPAFNAAPTLSRAIESCRLQDPIPEVLVVDDGSTDETRAVAESFGDDVVCLQQENAGCRIARNRGARSATGKFVVFLDADDELLPGWSSILRGLLHGDEGLQLLSGGTRIVDVATLDERVELPRERGPAFNNISASFFPGAYAVNRDLFLEVGGFWDEMRFWEHHELGIRIAARLGTSYGVSSSVIVRKFNDRSQPISDKYLGAKVESALAFASRYSEDGRVSSVLGSYCSVGARSAALLGRYGDARNLYVRSIRSGRRLRNLPRLGASYVPGVRELVWPPVERQA